MATSSFVLTITLFLRFHPWRSCPRTLGNQASNVARKKMKTDRVQSTPLAIYKDTKPSALPNQQPSPGLHLGSRAERNKDNCAIPTKWTSTKIPQKVGARATIAATGPCIEVFVDEECAEEADQVMVIIEPNCLEEISLHKTRFDFLL